GNVLAVLEDECERSIGGDGEHRLVEGDGLRGDPRAVGIERCRRMVIGSCAATAAGEGEPDRGEDEPRRTEGGHRGTSSGARRAERPADARDRAAVVGPDLDEEQGDEPHLDGLGEVGDVITRAGQVPGDDRRRGIPDQPEPDQPPEPDGDADRRDHRHRGDEIAHRIEREQGTAEGCVDPPGREGQPDDREPNGQPGRVRGTKRLHDTNSCFTTLSLACYLQVSRYGTVVGYCQVARLWARCDGPRPGGCAQAGPSDAGRYTG